MKVRDERRLTTRGKLTAPGGPDSRAPGALLRPTKARLERRPTPRRLGGLVVVPLLRMLALLPLRWAQALGVAVGSLVWLIPPLSRRARRLSHVNLAIAFPQMPRAERRRIARCAFLHLCRTVAELGAMWTWDVERIRALVVEVDGQEVLDDAFARGGVILAAPHLGAWDLAGFVTGLGRDAAALYRPPRDAALEEFSKRGRERGGARLVRPSGEAVRTLLRTLRRGGIVMILPDQDAGDGAGIFVPFFGELANTTVLVSRLASRCDARVVFAFAERLPAGRGFRLCYRAASPGLYGDLEQSAMALNGDIENLVRELPEQYLWSYKRFRIRPPGLEDLYREERD